MSDRQDATPLPRAIAELLDRHQSLESSLSECTALLRQALENQGAGGTGANDTPAAPWLESMIAGIQHGDAEADVVEALVDAMQYLLPQSAGAVSLVTGSAATSLVAAWRGGRRWSGLSAGDNSRDDGESLLHELSRESLEHSVRVVLHGLGMTAGELRIWPGGDGMDTRTEAVRAAAGIAGVALAGYALTQRLRQRSVRDALTGLFNHRYLEDTLEREIHRVRRNQASLGLILIGLDGLSCLQRSHGPEAADHLLEAAAGILQASFRGSDICCRLSEHRLCVVLPEADLDGTLRRAERLRRALRELAVERHGERLRLPAANLGVAVFPDHGDDRASLLAAAERALERAGGGGEGRIVRAERP